MLALIRRLPISLGRKTSALGLWFKITADTRM
jgi:hypothetical protein